MSLTITEQRGLIWAETFKQRRVTAQELTELWRQYDLMLGAPLNNESKMKFLIQQIIQQLQTEKFVIQRYPRSRPQYGYTTYMLSDCPPKLKANRGQAIQQLHQKNPPLSAVEGKAPENPMDNVGGEIILKKNDQQSIPATISTPRLHPFELRLKEGIMGMVFESGMPLKDAIDFPPEISMLGDGSGALIYRPQGGIVSLIPMGEGLEVKGDRLFLTKENSQVRKLIRQLQGLGLEAHAILAACQASQYTFRGQPITMTVIQEIMGA